MTNWIVIPVRGNLHLLRRAVDSALAQDIGNVKLFIVNNSEPGDGMAGYLSTLNRNHTVVTFVPQIGVGGGWNFALQFLFGNMKAERALVINQDVELPTTLYRILDDDCGEFVTAVSVKDRSMLRDHVISTRIRPHPDFSCFLIRKVVTEEVGWFDERYYPAFCEDADYHVRMHRAGIMAYCLDIPFYHVGSATVKNAEPLARRKIEQAAERNRQLFFETYGAHIGVPEEYDKLFTEETFGIDAKPKIDRSAT